MLIFENGNFFGHGQFLSVYRVLCHFFLFCSQNTDSRHPRNNRLKDIWCVFHTISFNWIYRVKNTSLSFRHWWVQSFHFSLNRFGWFVEHRFLKYQLTFPLTCNPSGWKQPWCEHCFRPFSCKLGLPPFCWSSNDSLTTVKWTMLPKYSSTGHSRLAISVS